MLGFMILGFLSVLVFILWKVSGIYKYPSSLKGIPGPGRNSFESLLILLLFMIKERSVFKWFIVGSHLYGSDGIFKFRTFTTDYLVLTTADTAEVILNNTIHVDKAEEYHMTRDALGDSLPICDAKSWKIRRKLINPAFRKQIIEGYIPIFNEKGRELRDTLRKSESKIIDFDPIIADATMKTIMETALGQKWQDSLVQGGEEMVVEGIHTLSRLFNDRIFSPWLWIQFIYNLTPYGREWRRNIKIFKAMTNIIINVRKEVIMKALESKVGLKEEAFGIKKRVSFLDLLLYMHLEDGTIDMQSIEEEVRVFSFAGHDTLTLSLAWTLFLLGHNPEIQKKVQAEIDQVMEQKEEVELEELSQMTYLEAVFKESLRLFPPGPILGRKLHAPAVINGHTIPKGTAIALLVFHIHRDPKRYPDPERFDPDRFLPENCLGRNPYSFLGFSGGPRGCIAQKFAIYEAKIFLTWILRDLNVLSTMAYDKVEFTPEVLLRSRFGMPLIFTKRNT